MEETSWSGKGSPGLFLLLCFSYQSFLTSSLCKELKIFLGITFATPFRFIIFSCSLCSITTFSLSFPSTGIISTRTIARHPAHFQKESFEWCHYLQRKLSWIRRWIPWKVRFVYAFISTLHLVWILFDSSTIWAFLTSKSEIWSNLFVSLYSYSGPMVPGLAPTEASERLSIFQAKFDDLWRKYITYSSMFQLWSFDLDNANLLYNKIQPIFCYNMT